MLRYFRLPLTFDAAAMAREVAALPAAAWTPHFNTDYHDGGWSGVALRAPGGDASRLYPDPQSAEACTDTPARGACPTIDAALATFGGALRSARLLNLAASGCIREHRDYGLALESGDARLHVPISSGAGVEFYLDGELLPMEPGECWYLNLDLPHRVQNLGTTERVHLVVDCVADDWILAQMPDATEHARQVDLMRRRAAAIGSSQDRLDELRRDVLADPPLLGSLAGEDDPDRFVARIVAEGRRRGLVFTAEDVRAVMNAGRREWIGRWLVR
jgi:hypothetical protein